MRICTAKSELKNKSRIEVSARKVIMNCTVLDGCAILWLVSWPTSSDTIPATVMGYLNSFCVLIQKYLSTGDVYLVFDRYITFSTKGSYRKARGSEGCPVYQLSASSPLPPRKQVLNNAINKKQLIQIIVDYFKADQTVLQGCKSKLIITGQDDTPIEISSCGTIIRREDLNTKHEEADVIVVAHAIYAAEVESKKVFVVADDTDIYVLVLHHYMKRNLDMPMIMQATRKARASVDIKATVEYLQDIIPDLLAAH